MGGLESLLASVKTSQNKTRCISDLGRESDLSAFSFIIVHRRGDLETKYDPLIPKIWITHRTGDLGIILSFP